METVFGAYIAEMCAKLTKLGEADHHLDPAYINMDSLREATSRLLLTCDQDYTTATRARALMTIWFKGVSVYIWRYGLCSLLQDQVEQLVKEFYIKTGLVGYL